MPLATLDSDDLKVIGECLHAAAYGPFFPEPEFSTLFGLSRKEVQALADRFPILSVGGGLPGDSTDEWRAINNSFNNLIGYPHGASSTTWSTYISVDRQALELLFRRWRG